MKTYVGPNGRLYQRENRSGRWVAATIICMAVIGVAIIGVPTLADGFRYFGL